MLDFKVGKTYKDTNRNKWEFCGYVNGMNYPYHFKSTNGNIFKFTENPNNYVSCEYIQTKIPFVEEKEKEREWVIGGEYECIDSLTQSVVTARLAKIIKETDSHLIYDFNVDGVRLSFHYEGIVLIMGHFAIFKDGIPQELKDRINKGKLTNKRKCFQKGKIYKNHNGASYEFKKRIKTKKGLLAVFEKEDGLIYVDNLYKMNNIECIPFSYSSVGVFLCADESIREESSNEAVRIMQ